MRASERSVQFAGGTLGGQRHICAFFNSIDEEHRVLRSFIRDGLEGGEKGFHIVDPDLRDEYLRPFAGAGINVEHAIATGLSLAKTPPGSHVVDQSALMRPSFQLDDLPPTPLASASPLLRLLPQC